MRELHRIIDKWLILLLAIVSCLSFIIFYQLNKETEYEQHTLSTQLVYDYYNQMLQDYYSNLETMDKAQAKLNARAKLYMVYNIEHWSRLKAENEEMYNAGRYEDKLQHYKSSYPDIVSYYEELKQNNKEILDQYIADTDAINMALSMYDKSFEYTDSYNELINGYIEQGNSMLVADMYSDKSSFEHINILKSKYDFRKLLNVNVEPDNSKALDVVITSGTYINMFILFIVLICVFRYFDDRKNGLNYIIHTARKGRGYFTVVRICTLAIASFLTTICVYVCVLAVAFRIYGGFEFMDNSLQSYDKYATICFTSNKWLFLTAFVLLSALAVFITGLVVWFITSLLDNVSVGMGLAVAILCVSYIMYMNISDKSRFAIFKNINIWNWIIPKDILTVYKNIGVGAYIISQLKAVVIIEVLCVIVFSISCVCINVLKHRNTHNIWSKLKIGLMEGCQAVISHWPLTVMELYKLLWVRKGIVILGIVAIIVSNINIKRGYVYSDDISVALKYYEEAEGMQLSRELTDIVGRYEDEYEYWNERLKQINTAFANETKEYSREDLNEASMQVGLYKNGLEEIHRNISNLEYLNKRNISGKVINPFAVEGMMGEKLYGHQSVYALLAVVALIFMLYPVISEEKKQNMLMLIHTASKGRTRWVITKLCAVLMVTIVTGVLVFIPNIINIIRTYNIIDMNILIQNYPNFGFIAIKMSLKIYFICSIIWKLILLVSIAGVIVLISTMFSYWLSLVVSMVLILPQLLYMLGFDWMYYISPVSSFAIEENWSRGINQINGVIVVVVGIICWIIYAYRIIENRK